MSILLSVKDLSVYFKGKAEPIIDNVSFDVEAGKILAIVGDSGSGKSVTAGSILRLNRGVSAYTGKILFQDNNLLTINKLSDIRGNKISCVFQNSSTTLNPVHTVGKQIVESIIRHQNISYNAAMTKVRLLLDSVGMPLSAKRINAYPCQFSGGQQQRILIAMALANNPELLIADEPITALDAFTRRNIINILVDLQKKRRMAMIFITHDLLLARKIGDKICVLYNGRVCEYGDVEAVFSAPSTSYTKYLINENLHNISPPPFKEGRNDILLRMNMINYFVSLGWQFLRKHKKHLLHNINLTVCRGETVGLMGESGSGKSTVAKIIMGLLRYKGEVTIAGQESGLPASVAQIVFQDPLAAMNPRMSVWHILTEGPILRKHFVNANDEACREAVANVLSEVGLSVDLCDKYISECSGGELQRIVIARALLMRPNLIVMDEPTSALDAINESRIVKLLMNIQKTRNLSYLLISHDIRIIKAMSHYVYVIKEGRIIAHGTVKTLSNITDNSYLQALLLSD